MESLLDWAAVVLLCYIPTVIDKSKKLDLVNVLAKTIF